LQELDIKKKNRSGQCHHGWTWTKWKSIGINISSVKDSWNQEAMSSWLALATPVKAHCAPSYQCPSLPGEVSSVFRLLGRFEASLCNRGSPEQIDTHGAHEPQNGVL
jgi:hypothetical protein